MASIRNEFWIDAAPDFVWDVVRDIGALHTRLVPGFVVNTVIEENPLARVVTFGNGNVARELIVDLDDTTRRLAWAIVGGRVTFYSASFQVFTESRPETDSVLAESATGQRRAPRANPDVGEADRRAGPPKAKSRCVWSADLLPNEMAAPIKAMILDSCATMKRTLEVTGASVIRKDVSRET